MYDLVNIVIPVYNEKENISNVFYEIETKVKVPHHIFVIYDSDADNTLAVIEKVMQGRNHVSLLKNKYGVGVLNAIKSGFEAIDNGVILVMMGDLSDDLTIVDEMFKKINQGYDIVCGSRYIKGGKQVGGFWFKKLLSRLAGLSLHYLTGVPTHDVTNNFKMYTKTVLNDIEIESNGGFELGMEIITKAFMKGYMITEVPSVWRDRTAGNSKFKFWNWLPKYLKWYCFALKAVPNRFWHTERAGWRNVGQ